MDSTISVVVPIYGSFSRERLDMATRSIETQKNVDLEIIIASDHTIESENPVVVTESVNPSVVRNQGILACQGKHVYVTDADIVLLNDQYLHNLLGLFDGACLHWPPMRRLPEENFQSVYNSFCSIGFEPTRESLAKSGEHLLLPAGVQKKIIEYKKQLEDKEVIYTAMEQDFNEYRSSDSYRGYEPWFWLNNVHCGGMLFTREQFEVVGGYCTEYVSWGVWDEDLH